MFRAAAIYGVLVLVPLYLVSPPPVRADAYYGFLGCALVFQAIFWVIGGAPVKYRALMLPAIAEKVVYALPALALFSQGKAPAFVVPFAVIDLILCSGFLVARHRTPA